MRRRELANVTSRLDSLIEAIADGLRTPGLLGKLESLEHDQVLPNREGIPFPAEV